MKVQRRDFVMEANYDDYYYFDPERCDSVGAKRLYEIGCEVIRLTGYYSIAIPIIKAASDHGNGDATSYLAKYWLKRGKYRKAAEFALAYGDEGILMKCLYDCKPGELDDIKRRNKARCKNFDPERKICVISGTYCFGDLCDWKGYTEA